jgi:hypothetical protein
MEIGQEIGRALNKGISGSQRSNDMGFRESRAAQITRAEKY